MTEEEYNLFVDECYDELERKQKILFEKYRIGNFESYWFEQETRILQFKNKEKVELEFEIVCIGTWAHQKNTWLWSWANESLLDERRKEAEVLKELRAETDIEIFEYAMFECDEQMAYEISAVCIRKLNSIGIYRIPGEKSNLFVALFEKIVK